MCIRDRQEDALGEVAPDVILDDIGFRFEVGDLFEERVEFLRLSINDGIDEGLDSFDTGTGFFHVCLDRFEGTAPKERDECFHNISSLTGW